MSELSNQIGHLILDQMFLEQPSFIVVLYGLEKDIRLIFIMITKMVFVRVIHVSTVRRI